VFNAMLGAADEHWWFRGRHEVLRAVIRQLPLPEAATLLDAGCGAGTMLDELSGLGKAYGADVSAAAVAAARARGHTHVVQAPVEELPYPAAFFDLVTCLDVLEHTPDDMRTLAELRRIVRVGGYAVLTVPAYQALWSRHDEANLHYRRYRRSGLRHRAEAAGWAVVRETSFNAILLAPIAVVRIVQRLIARDRDGRSDFDLTPTRLNGILELPMRFEAALIGRGRTLPIGLSHLMVLRRVGVDAPGSRDAEVFIEESG
jgi:SAM-dependent methyltransferase